MKRLSLYFALLVVLSLSAYSQDNRLRVRDLDGDIVREGASVLTPELYAGKFRDVLASGVVPSLDEAVRAAGEVVDPAGNTVRSDMTFVPFVDLATGKRGYYMEVAVSALDGTPLFEHEYTVRDLDCHCAPSNPEAGDPSPPAFRAEAQSFSSDVAKLARWIKAKQWASVASWISGQLARGVAKSLITNIVKAAFEASGYRCPNLAWWMPGKFYIYLVTCARPVY